MQKMGGWNIGTWGKDRGPDPVNVSSMVFHDGDLTRVLRNMMLSAKTLWTR
jgi:hypothetical protein